jgi:hypothetical protein
MIPSGPSNCCKPDNLEVKEIEIGPVDDELSISVRGLLAQQANSLERGWLWKHESGTYVKLMEPRAD